MRSLLAFLIAALGAAPLCAQPFSSDRPGFVNTPIVVPVGAVQVEAGATTLSGGGYRLPDALLRVALVRAVELRVLAPSATDGGGVTDAEVGFKMALAQGARVQSALLAAVSVDLDDLSAPSAGAAFTAALPLAGTAWSLAAQGGATYVDETNVGLAAAVAGGRALSDDISTYVELFSAARAGSGASQLDPSLTAQHGYALMLTPTMQIDASVALGLVRGPDWQVSVGWTGRF